MFPDALWQVNTSEQKLYLTFDDGPHPELTPWVLGELHKHKAKATFFCVGSRTSNYPEIIEQIKAEGHKIGHHSFHHKNGWKTKDEVYLHDILVAAEVVGGILFRPPYGKLKRSQFKKLKNRFNIVMWSVLSKDYSRKISKENCLKRVISQSENGSVIVFHDSEKAKENLQYVLPKMLEHFGAKGYSFEVLQTTPSN